MNSPLLYRYEGDGTFVAASAYWARKADDAFVVGETYKLSERHDRSDVTHNHYFACISNAWQSLPDHLLEHYPDAETLRKKMLIRAGYADVRTIVCASKAEALRVAAFVRPMDVYAIVTVKDAVVTVFTAQSQSYRAMGKQEFNKSKQAVLQAIDDLLGVERGTTAKQSEAA